MLAAVIELDPILRDVIDPDNFEILIGPVICESKIAPVEIIRLVTIESGIWVAIINPENADTFGVFVTLTLAQLKFPT